MSAIIATVAKVAVKQIATKMAADAATKKKGGSGKKWLAAGGIAVVLIVMLVVGAFMMMVSLLSGVTGSVASGLNIPQQPPYSSVEVEAWDGGDLATVRSAAYTAMVPWPTLVALIEQGHTLAPTNNFAWDSKADPQPDLAQRATAWANALAAADYRQDPIAALTATLNAPTSTLAITSQSVMTRAATITAAAQADESAPAAPEYSEAQIEALLSAGESVVVPPAAGGSSGSGGGLKTGAGAWGGNQNGNIPASAMSQVAFSPRNMLRSDAARALEGLNSAYVAQFGTNICITDSYRDFSSQIRLKAQKGHMAATPGTSNHGWGLALDLCGGINSFGTPTRNWFVQNAPAYGWVSPGWAQQGKGKPEAWHWEFAG